jgi:predicted Zn-dependent protease
MSSSPDVVVKPADHTLGHALGAVAGTAVDQARDLAVAQLDHWAERLRQRLETAAAAAPVASGPLVSGIAKPLVVGALAGAAVAWLLAGRRTET